MDDTNPAKEDVEYVDSIQDDVRWLGFEWAGETLYASDYFEQLYQWAEELIRLDKAYVDDLTADEIRELPRHADGARPRKPLSQPPDRGKPRSVPPHARRRVPGRRRASCAAKIDMASPNLTLRDPVLYRIRRETHHRTGDAWCIYPLYDYAHPLSDQIEGITHSLCTLEFEDHRPLYDWLLDSLVVPAPAATRSSSRA